MSVLDTIGDPDDLKALPVEQLPALAQEIRDFLSGMTDRFALSYAERL